jgi:RimJ/RimL family protein N-acetyltransferase
VTAVAAIESDRLRLVTLTPPVLERMAAGDVEGAGAAFGLPLPPDMVLSAPAALRLEQLARDPGELPWLLRAIVLEEPEPVVVGHIGFHAPPDERGRVEIGYTVTPAHRRCGYAREAVVAMAAWASREHGVPVLVASVSPDNEPSLGLVRGLGFVQVGDQWDEEDGLELVFERPLPIDVR